MQMSKEQFKEFIAAVRESSLPDAPKGLTEEAKRAQAKRAAIKKAAFKTKRFAHYIVGHQGAYAEGRLYEVGELIRLPLDKDPSVTFKPASERGVAIAEAEAAKKKAEFDELSGAAKDDDALDADELQAETAATSDEGDAEAEADAAEETVDDVEEVDDKPAKPAKKKAAGKKATAKPAPKRGKAGRASDQDVA